MRPGVRCTASALVWTPCTCGVQENGAICLVVLQTAGVSVFFQVRKILDLASRDLEAFCHVF